ncbi:hypothetical protein DFH27DRAFT_592204 [Peziza echinospora]|nr:hypothetical protein DFH27DRAFT_592204 [Peziza echinospora]
MAINRSADRNVHFHDALNPGAAIGGLVQNGSVTEQNVLDMLAILITTSQPIRAQERTSGHILSQSNNPLQPGEYDIHCDMVTNEPWVHRLITHSISGGERSFREGIRERDSKCVITGIINMRASSNNWGGFEAAHIFPLESESWWVLEDVTPGVAKINSRQNGFLLRGDIHNDFDNYIVSVNPDDNYKIIVFALDNFGVDGRTLDPVCRDPQNPHSVSDHLLRWHFRQSVLANMRGAGEPIFEHDYPPGTDIMGELRAGPLAQERLEMEFASRLR